MGKKAVLKVESVPGSVIYLITMNNAVKKAE
ncbi:hypothetical protein J2Z82_003331 [Virgibacillus litoralis]|uniref:Uncharacterized protein n=1 Tax=Virgibacillus litoralis TaxID=578221 RepID=A0ABS4HI19_9BACI|nr:hypothetical protein [Virgibacillus litoralis]